MNTISNFTRAICIGSIILVISGCQVLAPSPTATPIPPTKTHTPMPTDTFTPSPTATNTATPTATSTVTPTFTMTYTPTPAVMIGEWKGSGPNFQIKFEILNQDGIYTVRITDYSWQQDCGRNRYYINYSERQNAAMNIEGNSFDYESEWNEIHGELTSQDTIDGSFIGKYQGLCIESVDWTASWIGSTATP